MELINRIGGGIVINSDTFVTRGGRPARCNLACVITLCEVFLMHGDGFPGFEIVVVHVIVLSCHN